MTKQYYSVSGQDHQIIEKRDQFGSKGYGIVTGREYDGSTGKQAVQGNSPEVNKLAIRLNDGEIMYVNVDKDGWVEIRFSDNMKKVIKANADYFASYYR